MCIYLYADYLYIYLMYCRYFLVVNSSLWISHTSLLLFYPLPFFWIHLSPSLILAPQPFFSHFPIRSLVPCYSPLCRFPHPSNVSIFPVFQDMYFLPVPWTTAAWPYLPLEVGDEVVQSQWHRFWEQVRNTAASSNTLHACLIGPKKASLLQQLLIGSHYPYQQSLFSQAVFN